MSVEVRIIWYQSQVLKSGLLSFYLLFLIVILSCSVCVHYSVFLFCFVHQVKKKKKVKEMLEKKEKEKGGVDFLEPQLFR
jgi:hypothetical protein